MDLTSGSFRLFRAAGINVYLHWSWLLFAAVQLKFYPDRYEAFGWKVAEYVSLFLIVLLHEFGHAFACRSVGGKADKIVLWPLGGVAYVAPPPRPGAFLWSIAAGPLVNVVLLVPTFLTFFVSAAQGWPATYPDLHTFLGLLAGANLVMLVFNLLPIYPLDGGQILQSLLWFMVGQLRSLRYASVTGMVFGGLLLVASLGVQHGWMLTLIALFIILRSYVVFLQSGNALNLLDLPRHDDCVCRFCGLAPPRGPFWVCDHCRTRFDLFDTRGKCSGCGAWYLEPDCPHCHHKNHVDRWFPSPDENGAPPAPAVPAADPPSARPV
jgi:Zn-dependent protease